MTDLTPQDASNEEASSPPYKVYGVRIFVSDFTAARAFYNQILGLKELWAFADIKAAGYDAGATLMVEEAEEPSIVGRFVGLSLYVDDIEARYQELSEKGVIFSGPPEKQQWGGTLTHFKDTSDNVLTLLGD